MTAIKLVQGDQDDSQLVAAIGNFDGLHRGHQKLFKLLQEEAKKLRAISTVFTFNPHPLSVLSSKPLYLIYDNDYKIKLLSEFGIDRIYSIEFDQKLSQLSAYDFYKMLHGYKTVKMITGSNFNFGKSRQGNSKLLAKLCAADGIKHQEIELDRIGGNNISSTDIRKLLQSANFITAAQFLGRNWSIIGKVNKGQKLGSQIGIPTANIEINRYLPLGYGVFACCVKWANSSYQAIMNYGIKPTVTDDSTPTLEVHLLNFDQDIYGQHLEITPIQKIRPEKKFTSLDSLKKAILEDIVSLQANWERWIQKFTIKSIN